MSDRLCPWRAKPPEAVLELFERLKDTHMFVVGRNGPTSFVVKEEHSEVKQKITIGHSASCTCWGPPRPNVTHELCIHLIFVLVRVLRIPMTNPLVWQLSLLDRELDEALRCSEISRLTLRKASSVGSREPAGSTALAARPLEPGEVPRKALEPEEPCPICYEELTSVGDESAELLLVHCRWGCGRSVHGRCMRVWADHQNTGDRGLTCPLCRSDWGAFTWSAPRMVERRKAAPGPARDSHVHYGKACGSCKKGPIAGRRFLCLVCASYDLCEACFAHGAHRLHTFAVQDTPASDPVEAERAYQAAPEIGSRDPGSRGAIPGSVPTEDEGSDGDATPLDAEAGSAAAAAGGSDPGVSDAGGAGHGPRRNAPNPQRGRTQGTQGGSAAQDASRRPGIRSTGFGVGNPRGEDEGPSALRMDGLEILGSRVASQPGSNPAGPQLGPSSHARQGPGWGHSGGGGPSTVGRATLGGTQSAKIGFGSGSMLRRMPSGSSAPMSASPGGILGMTGFGLRLNRGSGGGDPQPPPPPQQQQQLESGSGFSQRRPEPTRNPSTRSDPLGSASGAQARQQQPTAWTGGPSGANRGPVAAGTRRGNREAEAGLGAERMELLPFEGGAAGTASFGNANGGQHTALQHLRGGPDLDHAPPSAASRAEGRGAVHGPSMAPPRGPPVPGRLALPDDTALGGWALSGRQMGGCQGSGAGAGAGPAFPGLLASPNTPGQGNEIVWGGAAAARQRPGGTVARGLVLPPISAAGPHEPLGNANAQGGRVSDPRDGGGGAMSEEVSQAMGPATRAQGHGGPANRRRGGGLPLAPPLPPERAPVLSVLSAQTSGRNRGSEGVVIGLTGAGAVAGNHRYGPPQPQLQPTAFLPSSAGGPAAGAFES